MIIIKTRNEVGGNNRQINGWLEWLDESHFVLFYICNEAESIVLLKYTKENELGDNITT